MFTHFFLKFNSKILLEINYDNRKLLINPHLTLQLQVKILTLIIMHELFYLQQN